LLVCTAKRYWVPSSDSQDVKMRSLAEVVSSRNTALIITRERVSHPPVQARATRYSRMPSIARGPVVLLAVVSSRS
jgi:hypothetical protein